MKLTTEIIILIFSAAAFAIGFAVRCVLDRIYSHDSGTKETGCAFPSENNIISFSRSIRERNASMRHAMVINADYKPNNILSTRKLSRPFTAEIPEFTDRSERNVIESFYRLVFNMLVNGK